MTCSYCGTRNGDVDSRCTRCGRKLSGTLYPTNGSLAAQPWRETAEPSPSIPPSEQQPQGLLFDGRRPAPARPKVIPFEKFAPARVEPAQGPKPKPETRRRAAPPPGADVRSHKPAARKSIEQPLLEFLPSASAAPRKLSTTVEARIYCDAPVATIAHRAVAAALDWSLVLMGFGVCLTAFHFAGGEFTLTRPNLGIFAVAYVLIGIFYGLLWTLAGAETAGMRWARLRLTNFDGFPPDRGQRLMRFAGACLSLCTAGAGLLWALADEESLTWHDHISGTFPTPCDNGSPIVRV